jgi:hypothetical protein
MRRLLRVLAFFLRLRRLLALLLDSLKLRAVGVPTSLTSSVMADVCSSGKID